MCMFMHAAWQYISDSVVFGYLGCDSGFSSLGCQIRHICNCTVVGTMLEKQDTQSCLSVHCMGKLVGFAFEMDLC